MGLRFVYGRAGTGKSYWCMAEIKKLLKEGDGVPLILIVPEQYTLQAEKDLVRAIGSTGIIGAEVMSFRRMAYRILNEVGGLARKTIDASGKGIFLCSIIKDMKKDLKVFSKTARQPGFIGVVSKTISEFKRYGVTPDDLERAGAKLEKGGLLRGKLQELSKIYRAFDEALGIDYVDSDDHLTILAQRLERCSTFAGAEIWLDGFSGFTPQEYKVIGKLLKKARRVNVCLCIDSIENRTENESGVFAPTARAVSRLTAIAKGKGIPIELPISMSTVPPHRFRKSKGLAHLEREYFNFPCKPYKGEVDEISIFAASNIYSEVEDVARYILKLCRNKGLRYKDIAVVAREPEMYNKLIGCIFDDYGIPYFLDSKKDISGNPLVQFIISTFDIFIHNWSYQSVFSYLKAGFTGIPPEDLDILENYVLAWGIKGSSWFNAEEWAFPMEPAYNRRGISDYEREMLQRVNEARRRAVRPLLELHAGIKGDINVKGICAVLYEFLCNLGVPERLQEKIDSLNEEGELNLANEYRQIWNIIIDVLDQMVDTLGQAPADIEGFRRLLKAGLYEQKLGLIPPALDQVLVADITRSKSHAVEGLCVLGINDGVFPAHSSEEGILWDRDRKKLGSMGIELAQDTRTKAMEEQFLIYSVLTTPAQYLRLSYATADYRGRSLRPSVIISRLKGMFPAIAEHRENDGRSGCNCGLEFISAPLPTFNYLITKMREQGIKRKPGDIWIQVRRWYEKAPQWKDAYKDMLRGLEYSSQTYSIGSGRARELYGEPLYTSISRLERFTACPFAYFVQYGLRARGRREFKLAAPDLGTFMHYVIDRFSAGLEEKGKTWRELDRKWCDREVSAIVDDILKENPELILTSSARYRHITTRLERILKRAVWTIAQHMKRSGFEPLGYELAFGGEKGGLPPILIELASGEKVYLTGRIDRVDKMETRDGTYLMVIDYKSGSKDFGLSDLYHGLQLQLITYLSALLESPVEGLKSPLLPAGFLYFRLDDPIIRDKSGMSGEEIERAVLKKLKMDGLVLADTELIKEMDRQIDGYSEIIPVRINKGGELGKSSAATEEQFKALLLYTEGLLIRTIERMIEGDVSIAPYKQQGFTPCNYCEYSAICQFDTMFKDNRYRVLKRIKDQQVWGLIERKDVKEKGDAK